MAGSTFEEYYRLFWQDVYDQTCHLEKEKNFKDELVANYYRDILIYYLDMVGITNPDIKIVRFYKRFLLIFL